MSTTVPLSDRSAPPKEPSADQPRPVPSRALWLAALLLLHLSQPTIWRWEQPGIWFPPAGVGFLLAAWLGPRVALLVVADGLLVLLQAWLTGTPLLWGGGATGLLLGVAAAGLSGLEVWVAWWAYFRAGRGLRGLVEPRSATLFLVLVPGGLTFLFAAGHALMVWLPAGQVTFWELTRALWFSRALGLVALAPPCLVLATPGLARRGWIAAEPLRQNGGADAMLPLALGGRIEIAGLALATGIFGLFLTLFHARGDWSTSPLAMLPLLLIIWASLRQGVRGGTLVATAMAVPSLTILATGEGAEALLALQANLLAQCSTALLVGVSFNWIRASEARYRHVVEHVPVMLYSARLLTPDGSKFWPESVEITFASPASRPIFGREPVELLGDYQTWLDCVHSEDHELLQATLSQLCRYKEPVTCEYRLAEVREDTPARSASEGSSSPTPDAWPLTPMRWVRDTFVPQRDEAGQLIGWEGVAEDITPQRHLADDLRRTTGMLHTLVNNLPAGVFFVEAAGGQPLLVNARARQLLGQREELAAGLTRLAEVYRLHRPDGSPYPAEEIPVCAALRRGTTSLCDDIVVHRPDGQRMPLVSWATPIDLGGFGRYDAVVWVLEDLSALRQTETALRESEARLRSVIENMAEGVLILDHEGTILDCNPAAGQILGGTRDGLRGRSAAGAMGPCVRLDGTPLPPAEFPPAVCARTRHPVQDVVIGLGPSGGESTPTPSEARPPTRWLRVRALPYSPSTSRMPPRVIMICTDVTAQQEAQAGQRRLEAGLEDTQRLGLLGRLAGGVAHDLNNYLTVVLTSAELAARSPQRDALAELHHIQEAGRKASELARQLSSLSTCPPAHLPALDLNNLVGRTVGLVRGTLGRAIDVSLELCPETPLLRGNETQLQQVLLNLCFNAQEAMPEGGRLTVATELLPGPPAELAAVNGHAAHPWVRLRVADTGRGISAAVQKDLFVAPVSDKKCGAGLGLWMTRRIVQEHGGQVSICSQSGPGTQVEIVLPAAV